MLTVIVIAYKITIFSNAIATLVANIVGHNHFLTISPLLLMPLATVVANAIATGFPC